MMLGAWLALHHFLADVGAQAVIIVLFNWYFAVTAEMCLVLAELHNSRTARMFEFRRNFLHSLKNMFFVTCLLLAAAITTNPV